jgi:exodeoxyribonuclease-5
MIYNAEQQTAIDNLKAYLAAPAKGQMRLLEGPAGTGKTTIMKAALANTNSFDHLVAAPTHKAVRVIHKMMRPTAGAFSTLHKAMALEMYHDDKGRQKFKKSKRSLEETAIDRAKIIVVEEVSMAEDELIKDLLLSKQDDHHIIFMGDEAQLPPVAHRGDVLAMPFRPGAIPNLERVKLTQIMRQGAGSDILKYATGFREQKELNLSELHGKEIERTARYEILPYSVRLFESSEYLEDRDRFKIMGYTNEVVDSYNAALHRRLYPDAQYPVAVGEQIILQSPYRIKGVRGKTVQNSDEFIVREIQPLDRYEAIRYDDEAPLSVTKVYQGEILRLTVEDVDGFIHPMDIPAKQSQWQAWLRPIKEHILSFPPDDRRWRWRNYYAAEGACADYKLGYAITIHKSQGSTYYEAAIDKADINGCWKPTYWRLAYTAVTRPSNKLLVVE